MIDRLPPKNCPGWDDAQRHLAKRDPVMRRLIERVGPCTLAPRTNYFACLCQSIISQQISTRVAAVIFNCFRGLHPGRRPNACHTLKLAHPDLRGAGLSRQKIDYLRSLAAAFDNGLIPVRRLRRLSDEEIVQHLIGIRGIGRWTAEMFLIFVMNRPDLLPVDDLGLRNSVEHHYKLKAHPTAKVLAQIAEPWRPYRSIATWYLWRGVALIGKSAT